MGRRSYGGTAESTASSGIAYQFERMHLNGLRRVSQEQQETVERAMLAIRDHVVKRMGEMLLQGATMLNEYCNICSGILMEERRGVRECITCDLLNKELRNVGAINTSNASEITNESSFSTTDHINTARDNVASVPYLPENYRLKSANDRQSEEELLTSSSSQRRATSETNQRCHVIRNTGLHTALKAIDNKMNWCAVKLEICEDLKEVMELFHAIECGAGILERYNNV